MTVVAAISPQAALLGLAWIAIVLVALAVAGLIRQVRELRAVVLEGFGAAFLTGAAPAPLHPAPGRRRALVLVVESVAAEPELIGAFAARARGEAGRTDAKLLSVDGRVDGPVPDGLTVVADPQAARLLRLPWHPAVVQIAQDGTIEDAAPAGSPSALDDALDRFKTPIATER